VDKFLNLKENKMKKIIVIFIFLISSCSISDNLHGQDQNEKFTIYLIRHSEKDLKFSDQSDPPLSECGLKRSKNLKKFFKNKNLDVIYTTDFERTRSTAAWISNSKYNEIVYYNPDDLEKLSKLLIAKKQNALVVGHSNTTGVLSGLLTGQSIGSYSSDIYNRIYRVVIYNDNKFLDLIESNFVCLQ
tara:strand:- start:112 stop:672 length:561 start_codon:yes stop_codon:yes gene_type:complete